VMHAKVLSHMYKPLSQWMLHQLNRLDDCGRKV